MVIIMCFFVIMQKELAPPFFPLTPGTVKDIRENGDEKCKRDFDEITMETDRINEELRKLQLQKAKLNAFQEKSKSIVLSQLSSSIFQVAFNAV